MRYPVFDPMMPDDYRPNPRNPADPAFRGAYCRICDAERYVGDLDENDGVCSDGCEEEDDDDDVTVVEAYRKESDANV